MSYSFKISTHHKNEKGRIFAWMGLISSIGFSSFITVLAVVLSQTLKSDVKVGYFFAFIAVIALLTSLSSTVLLRRFSKVAIAEWTLGGGCIAFLLFTVAANIWHLLIFDIIRAICVTLFLVVLAIFVRDYAKDNEIAIAEGRYYFFGNIGWFIGPFLGGLLAEYLGKEAAFIFSGFNYFATLLLFLHQHIVAKNPHLHNRKEKDTFKDFLGNMRLFMSDREKRKSFLMGFGISFWWALFKIYIPLTIIGIGYNEDIVGLVLSGAMFPLLFFEMAVAKKAQKEGVRKYITMGFSFLAVIVALFTVIKIPIVLLMCMILVNIGAVFIEPLHEAYFFQMTKKGEEEKLYGIYNTSYPLANILAPLFGSLVLSFSDMNGLWMWSAIIFLSIACVALSLKKKTV